MNRAVIGIGSNLPDSEKIVLECCKKIREIVEDSEFSTCYETVPVSTIPQPNYHNCVGIITTPKAFDEIRAIFKSMEAEAGRTKSDKQRGVVILDIDIVKWNDEVVSPRDFLQDYVQIGLRQLSSPF
ncbi:MAG: 2-amino-4-hydroxy-6-hydroxymethyldihydropteridine diphosphokinase [Bacteroidetes bacterium]|uniref:2-amino-4-hydroxy-6-hydroxymethyldihydropteridine pyrophosphokinase n=1 Tax=Candidatus Caccoplasma merdipullorum TaxID=2840718 RepID=A0A9D9H6M2_9BACT|nr:2-amino-4-hydroxy-6-hydroxymethyldihydropteridine diphosphokinase [Candidatus Caccoplasma merdipullorum]